MLVWAGVLSAWTSPTPGVVKVGTACSGMQMTVGRLADVCVEPLLAQPVYGDTSSVDVLPGWLVSPGGVAAVVSEGSVPAPDSAGRLKFLGGAFGDG